MNKNSRKFFSVVLVGMLCTIVFLLLGTWFNRTKVLNEVQNPLFDIDLVTRISQLEQQMESVSVQSKAKGFESMGLEEELSHIQGDVNTRLIKIEEFMALLRENPVQDNPVQASNAIAPRERERSMEEIKQLVREVIDEMAEKQFRSQQTSIEDQTQAELSEPEKIIDYMVS